MRTRIIGVRRCSQLTVIAVELASYLIVSWEPLASPSSDVQDDAGGKAHAAVEGSVLGDQSKRTSRFLLQHSRFSSMQTGYLCPYPTAHCGAEHAVEQENGLHSRCQQVIQIQCCEVCGACAVSAHRTIP
jgi:hypothetical protein